MLHLDKYCSSQVHIERSAAYQNWRRFHGLQLPLHTLQILGWLMLIFFVVVTFALLIPALGSSIRPPVVFVLGSLFCVHIVSHVVAITIDPADYELRIREKAGIKSRPHFDRAKHLHVIENGMCHLCNIHASGPQTKHCRLCNKCVERFDHHCKWLNQCVGARNYVAFLVCVVSAVLGSVTVLSVSLSVLVAYFVDPVWLDGLMHTKLFAQTFVFDSNYMAGQLPAPRNIFLCVLVVQIILSVVAVSFLLHLCLFHAYISVIGLTTYEYIRKDRPKTSNNNTSAPHNIPSGSDTSTSSIPFHLKSTSSYRYGSHDKLATFGYWNETSNSNLISPHSADECRSFNCQQGAAAVEVRANTLSKNAHSEPQLNGVRKLSSVVNHHRSADDIEAMYERSRVKEQEDSCKYCHEKNAMRRPQELHKLGVVALWGCCVTNDKPRTQNLSCKRNQVKPSDMNGSGPVFTIPRRSTSLNSLPGLSLPDNRQIHSVSLKELNEILAYAQRPESANSAFRTPYINNSLRRQLKRKSNSQLKPTKTPNLSPIHESGLSNPSTPHLRDGGSRPTDGLRMSRLSTLHNTTE